MILQAEFVKIFLIIQPKREMKAFFERENKDIDAPEDTEFPKPAKNHETKHTFHFLAIQVSLSQIFLFIVLIYVFKQLSRIESSALKTSMHISFILAFRV